MGSREDHKEETPPYSRIFVVCGKHLKEEELRAHFEAFGEIEDLYIPRDRNSGVSKGVAYIKYAKTSSAASAIEELHLKTVGENFKPFKVMVANNKHDSNVTNEDKYKRLFLKVPKQATENDIRKHFSEFGRVESVTLHRDKTTQESKGFAYVQYKSFLYAARAFEECDRLYRPMFATPKDELKRSRSSSDAPWMDASGSENCSFPSMNTPSFSQNSISALIKTQSDGYTTVNVTCSPQVPQRHIEGLFNIVPGMQQFQYSVDSYNGLSKALITFAEPSAAAYAVERIHNYEFPSGEIISVKPEKNHLKVVANDLTNMVNDFKKSLDGGAPDLMQLAEAIAQASTLIKQATIFKTDSNYHDSHDDAFWGSLPPQQRMLDFSARVAKRCFIVCKPLPPPPSALRDIFCRFGDLIDVSTFPNKTFGFAKYGSVRSADEAIRALNGATVCGVKLKVMEADEKPPKEDEDEVGRKRIKMGSD